MKMRGAFKLATNTAEALGNHNTHPHLQTAPFRFKRTA